MPRTLAAFITVVLSLGLSKATLAQDWKPTKQVEFVVSSIPGGAGDIFARTIQGIVTKYNLIEQPAVLLNKGGANGAEGMAYAGQVSGDDHKLLFTQANQWLMPLISRVSYKKTDMEPLAAMVFDNFLLWVKEDSPHKDAKSFMDFARANPGALKMGGANSKDADEILTKLIEKSEGAQITYIPFKGGGEAAVRLAGGVVDANVNNPSENVSYWRSGAVRPLCVFNTKRMDPGPKVTEKMSWSDIPTCIEAGLKVERFEYPRVVLVPSGVSANVKTYYQKMLTAVREKPEWKEYIEKSLQTDPFIVGKPLEEFVKANEARNRDIFDSVGWLVK